MQLEIFVTRDVAVSLYENMLPLYGWALAFRWNPRRLFRFTTGTCSFASCRLAFGKTALMYRTVLPVGDK